MPAFSEIETLEGGWRGTARTIDKMHALVAAGKLDPTLHALATWLRRGFHHNDHEAHRQALWNFLTECGLFQRDPHQVERIEHPLAAMEPVLKARLAGINDWFKPRTLWVGDCDLYSIMAGTIAGLWGYPYGFETAMGDARRPNEFSHVYPLVVFPDKGAVPFDATVDESFIGWRPPLPESQRKIWWEPRIEEAGVSSYNRTMGQTSVLYLPASIDDTSVDVVRPVRLEDLDGAPLTVEQRAAKAVDRAMQTVRENQVFAPQFSQSMDIIREGEPVLPQSDPSMMVCAIPDTPMHSSGDLEQPDLVYLKNDGCCPSLVPTERLSVTEQYLPKPDYHRSEPGVSRHEFLDPSYPWVRQVAIVDPNNPPLPDPTDPTASDKEEAVGAEGMGLIGMGEGLAEAYVATDLSQPSVPVPAAAATSSVWGSIANVATGLLQAAPELIQSKISASLQKTVLAAQQKVLDAQTRLQTAAAAVTQGAGQAIKSAVEQPIYKNPIVLGGAAALLAFVGYKMLRPTGRRSRR